MFCVCCEVLNKGVSAGMETSKRHLPFSGHEERELKRMAVRSDEKIYIAATSQANNCLNPMDPDQMRNANGGDWQEEVHQKIKAMKDLHLHDLNHMHHKILGKLQQVSY
nr:mediator of RNA polymerase II transcription subunit 15A isoform X1 [Tanacetum cinerariifolium]